MSKFQVSFVVFVGISITFGIGAPLRAVTIYEDNFQSYDISGGPIDIVGQVAPTGQTYTEAPGALAGLGGTLPSMQVLTELGVNSTQGVGDLTTVGLAGIHGASVDFGTTYTTGIYTLGMDYRLTSEAGAPQIFLGTGNISQAISVAVEKQGANKLIALQGSGLGNHIVPGATYTAPVDMHLELTVDLDLKSATLKWQGLDANNLSQFGTYTTTFPNTLTFSHLHMYNGANAGAHGFDNFILVEGLLNPAIPGDLNGDGFVGQDDLNIVLGDWGNMPPGDPRADPSGDGFVGQDDLNPVLADWGQGTPPPTFAGSSLSVAAVPDVPEPSSMLLLAIAVPCGLTLYRRHQRYLTSR